MFHQPKYTTTIYDRFSAIGPLTTPFVFPDVDSSGEINGYIEQFDVPTLFQFHYSETLIYTNTVNPAHSGSITFPAGWFSITSLISHLLTAPNLITYISAVTPGTKYMVFELTAALTTGNTLTFSGSEVVQALLFKYSGYVFTGTSTVQSVIVATFPNMFFTINIGKNSCDIGSVFNNSYTYENESWTSSSTPTYGGESCKLLTTPYHFYQTNLKNNPSKINFNSYVFLFKKTDEPDENKALRCDLITNATFNLAFTSNKKNDASNSATKTSVSG